MAGYISEVDYDGGAASNFVEIVLPRGTDPAGYKLYIYNKDGQVVSSYSLGDSVGTFGKNDVYMIDSNDAGWVDLKNSDGVALVDNTNAVQQFIAFKDPVTATQGPAAGMSATQVGQHSGSNKSLVSSDGGASYSPVVVSTAGTVPCYGPGTLIDTPGGPRPVETLVPGDRVLTLDDGPSEVLWVSTRAVPLEGGDRAPILIRAGALGAGRPARDLIVSPQHRILVGGQGQLAAAFDAEGFAPAKSLTGLPGVRAMRGRTAIVWHHFACARHGVVRAEGCWSESLLLGPMVLLGMGRRQRGELRSIFPAGDGVALNGPPARPCLTVRDVRDRLGAAVPAMEPADRAGPGSQRRQQVLAEPCTVG